MKTIHKLKIDECYLEAKLAGDKMFEIRVNDRGYQKGDAVIYTEYGISKRTTHKFEITYVTGFLQQPNHVVFGERFLCTEEK